MNYTSRSNYFAEAGSGGNYQLCSAYELGSSDMDEEYCPATPVRRKTSRNVLMKSERRRHCSSPSCVFWVSPSTPRSLLPRGMCECALDSLPSLPKDHASSVLPQDLYSALQELELATSQKDSQPRSRRPKHASPRHGSDTPPSGSSTPRTRLLLRLKLPSGGRRSAKSDRSAIFDTEFSPSSSAASSRFGSPLARRSPTPFTPRNTEPSATDMYNVTESEPALRADAPELDTDMPMAGTESKEQNAREQGSGAKQDPLIVRLKIPDSMRFLGLP
ncbi:hypothetical protein BDV93DRAFT_519967 [Ceratobasidium sp. AG-I]|nr:hypothetical protein BDV93DRAFT_519967 [Ceratobasidium sp. AG-I]